MNRSILDTDTLSYIIDQRHAEVVETARQYIRVFRRFTISAITVAEVVKGLEARQDPAKLSAFLERLDSFEILALEEEEAVFAGKVLGKLFQQGRGIGSLDPFIAATAITHGLPLITNNENHYQRIVEAGFPLQIANWRNTSQ